MFKNLKSLFIEDADDSNKSPKNADPKKEEKVASTSPTTSSPSVSSSTPPAPGKFNEKFSNILLGAMDKNNIDGFDYLEYRQSLKSLTKMDMDEATRYKSAYAMAQTMGASPDHLIKTANHYLDVLKQEEVKFGDALKNQRTKQIGEKEQQLKDHAAMIKQKADQIQKLSKEIEEHQAKTKKIEAELTQSNTKVEVTKNDFVASYNIIVGQIMADVENMKKYLK